MNVFVDIHKFHLVKCGKMVDGVMDFATTTEVTMARLLSAVRKCKRKREEKSGGTCSRVHGDKFHRNLSHARHQISVPYLQYV